MILEEINPIWQWEQHKDIPMMPEQYQTFCKGYTPSWECRYEPISLGDGCRSGFLVKKFRYELGDDGLYHLKEHFTTEKEKDRDILHTILIEGDFNPSLMNIEHSSC